MLRPCCPQHLRTASLRAPRYSKFDKSDEIVTKPNVCTRVRKIIGFPVAGWGDDYEKSGRHFSRRLWRTIGNRSSKWLLVRTSQERRFSYNPAVPWEDNPASFDE